MTRYYALAGGASVFASALLALQIVGGLEYTSGQSAYVRWSMIAAMVTVALLPIAIDMVARMSRMLALFLILGFVAFLAYSLPASIGRIGEVKEAKALVGGDAAQKRAELHDLRATLKWAEPDAAAECEGAPDPVPAGRWPECRRKRGTVKALKAQEAQLDAELARMGTSAQLGDISSKTLEWAFSPLGVSEATIRKASGLALPIGLEVVIFSLFGAASVAIRKAWGSRPVAATTLVVAHGPAPLVAETLTSDDPPSGGTGRKFSRDEALADLWTLHKAGQRWDNQEWLRERWGYPQNCKGTISRWFSRWEEEDELPGDRVMIGRNKTLRDVAA